jgi:hypothetical protein
MPDTTAALRVIDLLGVFYEEDTHLMVVDEFDGSKNVDEVLSTFQDSETRLLAHHRPHEPHDKTRWGGGCCHLENTGECHFGHHERPDSIYTFNASGILRREEGDWVIEKEDGSKLKVYTKVLVAHRSQIVITSVPDLSQIEEKVKSFDPSNLDGASLDELTDQLKDMKSYLEQLHKLQKNIDG